MLQHCLYAYIYIRGGMVNVFVPNGTELSVRCKRPYDEYRKFTPNPEGGTCSNATLLDNCQQKNRESHELRVWKQSPLDSDHVLILSGLDYLWIIVKILSAVWTLILTAPIHCIWSIDEQVRECITKQ